MEEFPVPGEEFRNLWENFLKTEQIRICDMFSSLDQKEFEEDGWKKACEDGEDDKAEGGFGIIKIMQEGTVFQKCVVNCYCRHGPINRNSLLHLCVNQYKSEYTNTEQICDSSDINKTIVKLVQYQKEPFSKIKKAIASNKNKIEKRKNEINGARKGNFGVINGKNSSSNEINNKNQNEKYRFYDSGLSVIVHPVNPNAPSIHCSFRFFQILIKTKKKNNKGNSNSWGKNYRSLKYWFGGDIDLSPCYIFVDLFKEYHTTFKEVCDKFNHLFYKNFKTWCDLYFRIQHRNMNRGIGGIYFDHLVNNVIRNKSKNCIEDSRNKMKEVMLLPDEKKKRCTCYSCSPFMDKSYKSVYLFIQECLIAFRTSYLRILLATIHQNFDGSMIMWQKVCRSRITEFNLLYDRRTKFEIQKNKFRMYKNRNENQETSNTNKHLSISVLEDENYQMLTNEPLHDYSSQFKVETTHDLTFQTVHDFPSINEFHSLHEFQKQNEKEEYVVEYDKVDDVLSGLPLHCQFIYKFQVRKDSREYETLEVLKHPKKWTPD